ncbi:MAG: hypothetical protein V2A79_20175 [Planctomycetota bacterium]
MSHENMPLFRRVRGCAVFVALAFVVGPGCATQWYYSYAELEQQRLRERQQGHPGRDTLLFYKDHLDAGSGRLQDILESPQIKPLITGKLRCVLIKDYAPNQRYMAQYGVDSPPALVVVHPDATYHARQGFLTVEQARDFLAGAVGPGATPKTDIQILPVSDYYWQGSYEEAVALAERQNRPLFIVYKWWLSAESTELLNRLSQPRVRSQFSEMVHCLLDWDYIPNRGFAAQYGVSKVPSMIIVRPDGTYHTLIGLPTVDQIVRFAASAHSPGRAAPARGRLGITPAIPWQYSYERARSTGEQEGRKLFVFYHSVFVDASNRSAQLLDTPEAAALLAEAICCRLDWVVVKNRATAAQFGLQEPPGCVVLRPDGTYHARSGSLSLGDLSALLQAAEQPGARPRPAG